MHRGSKGHTYLIGQTDESLSKQEGQHIGGKIWLCIKLKRYIITILNDFFLFYHIPLLYLIEQYEPIIISLYLSILDVLI